MKKSEALAANILEENLSQRQDNPGFEQTIGESRQKMLTLDHLDRIRRNEERSRSMEDLTEEQDESNLYSGRYQSENDDDAHSYGYSHGAAAQKSSNMQKDIEIKALNGKSDQMFFEFFGMYTKESIKVQKRTEAKKRVFNTRSI